MFDDKVKDVCGLIESVLIRLDQKKYLTSLMSIDLANDSSSYRKAISRIGNLMNDDYMDTDKWSLIERATNYIISLSNAESLYDCALGTYNLRLALMIAEKSQKVRINSLDN